MKIILIFKTFLILTMSLGISNKTNDLCYQKNTTSYSLENFDVKKCRKQRRRTIFKKRNTSRIKALFKKFLELGNFLAGIGFLAALTSFLAYVYFASFSPNVITFIVIFGVAGFLFSLFGISTGAERIGLGLAIAGALLSTVGVMGGYLRFFNTRD
jgi:hypothetical protein